MKFSAFLLTVLLTLPAVANEAAPNADDPVIEQRMNVLAEDLRCLVCQNESLAGSHAELAEDLRREIRAQMKLGKSDAEVIDYLTTRYGDFVLYRPPFKPVTYFLWLGPFIFLGIGAAIAFATLKRRRKLQMQSSGESKTDSEALKKAAALLEQRTD